jgi:hypothetical protein
VRLASVGATGRWRERRVGTVIVCLRRSIDGDARSFIVELHRSDEGRLLEKPVTNLREGTPGTIRGSGSPHNPDNPAESALGSGLL